MLIEDIPRQSCIDILSHERLGRLACVHAGQPYITPLFFVYHSDAIYSFSTIGQKIDWMRANPLVCVEIDEVKTARQWSSVIVFGRYEELSREYEADRQLAYNLLHQRPNWWEPGYANTAHSASEPRLELIYFRIHIGQITGRRATN